MNIKEMIDDLKMDKKTFKKLSKGSAYKDIYEPMVDVALGVASDLEKSEALLQIAEEEVKISSEHAENAQKEADEANARAESAEKHVEEARAFQNEAVLGVNLLLDQINKVSVEKSEAERLKQKSDSKFSELMADTLNKKSLNKALSKLSFNAENNSDEDLEALKVVSRAIQNEMSENDRQIALNKASMEAIKSNSVKAGKTLKSKDLELKLLEEDYNNALKTIGELVVNGALKL